jgi:hypothetical protein
MNHYPPSGDKPDPERYLKDTADAFFFDPQSGIHQPKAYQSRPESNQRASNADPAWRFCVTTILSALTLIAVSIYACYAALQWREMQKAADAANLSAVAARDAVKQGERTMRIDERAWVGVKSISLKTPLQVGNNVVVEVVFTNSGKTLANEVRGYATLAVSKSRTLLEFPEPPRELVESVSLDWPNLEYKIFVSGSAKTPLHQFAFTQSEFEYILTQRAFFFVYGTYTYVDIFDCLPPHHAFLRTILDGVRKV